MTVQDVEKDKPKYKSILGLPSLEEIEKAKKTGQFVPAAAPYSQTEEERLKEEEFQAKGPLGKIWTGLEQFWYGNLAGLQYGGARLAPVITKIPAVALGARMVGMNKQDIEDALISTEVYKDKARENLEKAEAIYGHGFWNEVGKAAPFIAAAVASGGLGLGSEAAAVAGRTTASILPELASAGMKGAGTLINEAVLGSMVAGAYGNSLMESDAYSDMTGKPVSEFQKQSSALVSAASMLIAFRIAGGAVSKLGDAYGNVMSTVLRDNPRLTSTLVSRFIAETPGAAQKLIAIGKQTAGEAAKVGGGMALMSLANDFMKNLEKYPEDRLALEEIATNTITSFKSGAFLGAMLGPFSAGIGEGYHYFRRKRNGINLIQTSDGKVYEKVADKDDQTYTVVDKFLKPRDIKRSDVVDQISMTKPELDRALDAYRTNSDALPEIEKAIYTNYARRSAQDLARQITTTDDNGNPAIIFMTDKDGHTFFEKELMLLDDGLYANLGRVERDPQTGEVKVKDQMVRIGDKDGRFVNGWKISNVTTPEDFVKRGVDAYRAKKGWIPGVPSSEPVKDSKTGQPISPEERQTREDEAYKAVKIGQEVDYEGRKWEIQEIGFDGTLKAVEIKEDGQYGEIIDIPYDKLEKVGEKVEEPTKDIIPAEGKKAKPGEPVYMKDGVPVSKGIIKGVLQLATSSDQLMGYTWENDKELDKLYKKRFPGAVQNWFIDGKEVTRDEMEGAISVLSNVKDLERLKIQHDPGLQQMLDDKIALLPKEEKPEKPVEKPVKQPGPATGLEVPVSRQEEAVSETTAPPDSELKAHLEEGITLDRERQRIMKEKGYRSEEYNEANNKLAQHYGFENAGAEVPVEDKWPIWGEHVIDFSPIKKGWALDNYIDVGQVPSGEWFVGESVQLQEEGSSGGPSIYDTPYATKEEAVVGGLQNYIGTLQRMIDRGFKAESHKKRADQLMKEAQKALEEWKAKIPEVTKPVAKKPEVAEKQPAEVAEEPEVTLHEPFDFEIGDLIQSYADGTIYKVIGGFVSGKIKIQDVETGKVENIDAQGEDVKIFTKFEGEVEDKTGAEEEKEPERKPSAPTFEILTPATEKPSKEEILSLINPDEWKIANDYVSNEKYGSEWRVEQEKKLKKIENAKTPEKARDMFAEYVRTTPFVRTDIELFHSGKEREALLEKVKAAAEIVSKEEGNTAKLKKAVELGFASPSEYGIGIETIERYLEGKKTEKEVYHVVFTYPGTRYTHMADLGRTAKQIIGEYLTPAEQKAYKAEQKKRLASKNYEEELAKPSEVINGVFNRVLKGESYEYREKQETSDQKAQRIMEAEIDLVQERIDEARESGDSEGLESWENDLQLLKTNPAQYWHQMINIDETSTSERDQEWLFMQKMYPIKEGEKAPLEQFVEAVREEKGEIKEDEVFNKFTAERKKLLEEVTKEIKEPETDEERIAAMQNIEYAVEKAGFRFEVEWDEDPDFSTVNVFYGAKPISVDSLPAIIKQLFNRYTTFMHESHENKVIPGALAAAETEEPPQGPVKEVVEGMAKIAEREKLDRQRAMQDNKLLAEQKQRLLDDLYKAEDILFGKNREMARKYLADLGGDKPTVDMQMYYDYDLAKLPKNVIDKLAKLGIKVVVEVDPTDNLPKGKLVIDIYKDGTVVVGNLRNAIDRITKEWPRKEPPVYRPSGPGKPRVGSMAGAIAESLGSLEEAEQRVKAAEANLKEATTPGLKKVMQEYLDEARAVLEFAKKIDYEALKLGYKIDADEEFGDLYSRIQDRIYFYDINKTDLYKIIEKYGRPAELTPESILPLIVRDQLEKLGKTLPERIKDLNDEIQNLESELKQKFGRKDGKGLVKPKNQREEWEMRSLNSRINRALAEIEDLETVKPRIDVKEGIKEPIRPVGAEEGKGIEDIVPGGTEVITEGAPAEGKPEFAGEVARSADKDLNFDAVKIADNLKRMLPEHSDLIDQALEQYQRLQPIAKAFTPPTAGADLRIKSTMRDELIGYNRDADKSYFAMIRLYDQAYKRMKGYKNFDQSKFDERLQELKDSIPKSKNAIDSFISKYGEEGIRKESERIMAEDKAYIESVQKKIEEAKTKIEEAKGKYVPYDDWQGTLMKARDYASHLFTKEELDRMTADGTIVWNDKESIVNAINERLGKKEESPFVGPPQWESFHKFLKAIPGVNAAAAVAVDNYLKKGTITDPQNFRIHLMGKINPIITDYWVNNFERLRKDFGPVELTSDVIEKVTDLMQKQFLPEFKTMGEIIQQINTENISQLMEGGRAGVLKPEAEVKLEAWKRYEEQFIKPAEFAGEKVETVQPKISVKELNMNFTVPVTHKDYDYPHKALEPVIKRDVTNYAKEVAGVLGWEHETDKKGKIVYAHVNLPPAGGDAWFKLYKPGSDIGIYVTIPYQPVGEMTPGGGYSNKWAIRGVMENQGYGPIMYRLTSRSTGKDNANHWIGVVNAGEMANQIKKLADAFEKATPTVVAEKPMTAEEKIIERNKQVLPKLPLGRRGAIAYKSLLKAIPILKDIKPGDYFKSGEMGDPIMPFSIEAVPIEPGQRIFPDPDAYVLTLAHTYTQMGDLMWDPRIDVAVYPAYGIVMPLLYQQSNLGIYREYVREGRIDEKGMTDTFAFIPEWMNNIVAQGRSITGEAKKKIYPDLEYEQRPITDREIIKVPSTEDFTYTEGKVISIKDTPIGTEYKVRYKIPGGGQYTASFYSDNKNLQIPDSFATDGDLEAFRSSLTSDTQETKTPQDRLVDLVKTELESNQKITNTPQLVRMADAAGMKMGEHYTDIKQLYDIASLALNKYINEVGERFNPFGKTAEQVKNIVNELINLQDLLPTETQRSRAMVELQQFSTPSALAFLANWVADVGPGDTMLEPSAGEGNIAIFGKNTGARVVVNEYDQNRINLLKMLGFDKITKEDAKYVYAVNSLKPDRITVVTMNPPFSKDVALGGKMDLHGAEKHITAALKKLEPEGRLVAIVGKGMGFMSPTHREWWDKIKQEYTVVANISINGDAYAKKGTSFDNRLIVIDKTGPTKQLNDIVTGYAETYLDLVDLLDKIPNKIRIFEKEAGYEQLTGYSEEETTPVPGPTEPNGPGPATTDVGGIQRGTTGQPKPVDLRQTGYGEPGTGTPSENRPVGNELAQPGGQRKGGGRGTTARGGGFGRGGAKVTGRGGTVRGDAGETGRLPEQTKTKPGGEIPGRGISVVRLPQSEAHNLTNRGYDKYTPQITLSGSKEHPTPLVESSAMASVPLPETDYTPMLNKSTVESGALSSAQLEDIILAGNANKQILPSGERRGFFLGAGTGYGKGRTIAGILLDNYNRGSKKGLWISLNDKAHRDSPDYWTAVGGDEKLLVKSTPSAKDPIKIKEGILLTTYGTMRSKFNPKLRRTEEDLARYFTEPFTSRVQQLAQWLGKDFDGVIVFDESHAMANAVTTKGTRGRKKPSNTALAGMELQRMLPNAKIIYSSATGATEVSNLVYAQRLGLWGDGTAFEKADNFIEAVETAGVSGMEIISKDLKSMGLYTAKTLSFDGVEYDTVRHDLLPAQVDLYNQVADAWQIVLRDINKAIEGNQTSAGAKSAAMSAFWGAHQRFFGQIINTMQMPTLIKDIQRNLDQGNAVVIQLVNTNEAQLDRALAEAKEESEIEPDLEELDLSPKNILIDFLYNSFPVVQYEDATDPDGNIIKVVALDSEGNIILNPEAVKLRDDLLAKLDKELVLPESPIDLLINTFGVDNVAEATGRSKRVVIKPNREGKLVKQEETRTDSNVTKDINDFMDGEKNLLIFSKAGGTGASYHSDLTRKNQKKRVHYVLQAGWQADAAIQGFGRSHRSNQRVPPLFKLVTTNLKAQRRFLSSIARRLEQLGALTKGQRDTGGGGILDGSFNLEGKYARQALFEFYHDVEQGRVEGVTMSTLEDQMALKIYRDDPSGTRVYNENVVFNTRQFLNRLMSLRVDLMDKVFEGFIKRLEEEINTAIISGSYDAGIENVKAEKIRVVDEQEIYTDPQTKGKTYITTFELTLRNEKKDWKAIMGDHAAYSQFGRAMGFYKEKHSGKVYLMVQQRVMEADGSAETKIKRTSVVADQHIDYRDLREKYDKLDLSVAEELWNKDYAEYPDFRTRTETIVKGLILPIWSRLPNNIHVKRYIDENGQAHLGRYFPPKDIQKIVNEFKVASTQKYSPDQIKKIVKEGGMVRMSNGFEFIKSKYQGIPVIQIQNTRSYRDGERLERAGAIYVVSSSLSMAGDYYIPMDKSIEVISEIEKLFGATVVHAQDADGNFIMAQREGPKFVSRPRELRETPSIWDDPRFRSYELAPGEFASEQMKKIFESEVVRRAKIMMAHSNVKIVVVKTKNDLPTEIQSVARMRWGDLANRRIPSVYDSRNKVIYIVVEDNLSIPDLVSNMAHEIVAHYGLERLLGKDAYDEILNLTFRGMSPVDKAEIADRENVDPSDWRTIAEEYIGDTAGAGKMNPSLWQRIIAKIREWIRKLFNIPMSEAEIVTLLGKSRVALKRNKFAPEPSLFAGEVMTGYAARPEARKTKDAYGIKVSTSKELEADVAKGNQDYRTYFAAAKSVIGEKAAKWIERAMVRANFNEEKIMDYLNSKILRYRGDDKLQKPFVDALEYFEANPPKRPEPLYELMIGKGKSPDELRLIDRDKPVYEDQMESVMNQLDYEGMLDATFNYRNIQSGADLYRKMTEIYGSEREASLALSRAGIDGMRFLEPKMGKVGAHWVDSYIIFDNTPVEILNEIKFKSVKKPVIAGEHITRAGRKYTPKQVSRKWKDTINEIREEIQDIDLPIRKFEEEVLRRGGIQTDEMKPYRDRSLTFGRQEFLYKQFTNIMEDIVKTTNKISNTGMPKENILPYIISKHAPERNRVLRMREFDDIMRVADPNLTQAEVDDIRDFLAQKDYAGVMAFDTDENDRPLGNFDYPDDLAKTITDEFEAAVPGNLIDELWSNIRKASQYTLDIWEEGLQISPELKEEYMKQYNYFVPLRGWRHGPGKYLKYTKGHGFTRSLIHAEGRISLADNPLAYFQLVAFKAIGELVDNEVRTAMLKLLIRNLSSADLYDMATVKKLYYIATELPDGTYEWEPTLERPPQAMFDEGSATMRIYTEHHRLKTPGEAKEDEVVVRRENGDVVMIFKPKYLSVAQALNKRNYMYHGLFGGIKDARIMNEFVTNLGLVPLTNFIKATLTSWNVVFPFTNFLRDAPEAALTQLIKGESGPKVVQNYARSFPALISYLRGKIDMNNPDHVETLNFYKAGGATGFTHPITTEDAERKMMRKMELLAARGTAKGELIHYGKVLLESVEMWNQLFEDATRLSVYLTSRQLGKSIKDAASDAKEASINMNRKGMLSKMFDALYAFFNVSFQGMQKNFKLAKDFPRRFAMVAGAWMAIGFLDALMNYATDDEDEESKYYNINPWMRQNYLIIPNLPKILSGDPKGPKYVSIPLPHFWRGFKSIGSLTFDIITGKETPATATRKAIANFGAAMLPIDVGGFWSAKGEFSLAPVIPTIGKPFYEIATNRNYMGYPIAREPFDRSQEKLLAQARLGKDNVNPAAKFFTDLMFRWSGGDNATKFYTDDKGIRQKAFSENLPKGIINPSYLEHIFKGFTGGTGAVISDLITTVAQTINPDEEINFRNVPFVNRFIRMTPESKWRIMAEYYDLKEGVTQHKALKREYTKKAEGGEGEAQLERTEGASYYEEYQDILDSYDAEIESMSKELTFDDIEGTKPMWDLMQSCINDIKALKKEYNMK